MLWSLQELLRLLRRVGRVNAERCNALATLPADACWAALAEDLSEAELVEAVHRKLLVPVVDAQILADVPQSTVSRLDSEHAQGHEALPITVDADGNVTVAMSNPLDALAGDAIARIFDGHVIRAIAPRTALLAEIGRRHGKPPARVRRPTRDLPASDLDAGPAPVDLSVQPEPPADAPGAPQPLDAGAFDQFEERMYEVQNSGELADAALDFLATGFRRVILFTHLRGQLRGRDCRGADLVADAVRQVCLPADQPSIFADVIQHQRPYFGPMPAERDLDRAFAAALEGIHGSVLALPVALAGGVPLVVFASEASGPIDPGSLGRLIDAVSEGLARVMSRRS